MISIVEGTDIKASELYDLKSDPNEVKNQLYDNERTVYELLSCTKNFYNEYVTKKEVEEARINDAEIENRLRALRYM